MTANLATMMRATNVNHLDMWRRLLTATLCATTAGGFDVPFAHRASVQAPCTPKLDSLATASSCSRVRCRRRPTRTATMMAGPNKGQKPAFFADWPVLEAELRSYLVEREAGEPKDDGRKPSPARNPMLNFLSIDPTGMALQDAPDADEWDGEIDALAYSELTRYGYGYLVEPMMNAGGYAVASELMGINLNSRTLKTREYYERMNPQQGLKENVELDGFLTLGRAREDRLDSVAEVDREERSKSLFEKQAMMDKVKKAEAKAAKPTFLSPRKVALGGRSQGDVDDEVFRPPGLPEDQRGPSQWIPPARDDSAPLQPLLLSLPQRANTVAVFFSCAVAFGRGTAGALEAGLLPQEVAEAAVPASLFLLGLNVASAAVGGSIAKGKGRSVPLWVFKGAVAGVTSVLELKGLPDLDLSAGLSPGAGAGESST